MHSGGVASGPWFRRHPRAATAVAFALYVVVTLLRFSSGDARDATLLLLALPVTLVALAFGARAGAAAAVGAVGALAAWALITGAELGPLGWTSRVLPFLLLGFLVGRASDDLVAAEAIRLELALSVARQRHAAEIHDGILQRVAAAKWSVEGGRTDEAVATLTEAMTIGESLVEALLRDAADARQVQA